MQQMQQVPHLRHLGYPLPAHLSHSQGYRIVVDELRAQIANLNAHPIQTLDSVTVVNTVVLPRLHYLCEGLLLTP